MKIDYTPKLDFHNVLIKPKRTMLKSRSEVDLLREMTFLHSPKNVKTIPIVAANMDTVGTIEMALALNSLSIGTALHKHYSSEELILFFKKLPQEHHIFYSMGVQKEDVEKLITVKNKVGEKLDKVCIDVANGYTTPLEKTIKIVRTKFPELIIMAGNVATPDMTEHLIISGADIVKVGIGPGSACTTRKKTGVGVPQLSAIMECTDAAKGVGGRVCGDGGCVSPGDVAKAFGGGADYVMLGGMLAGHDESGGELIEVDGKRFRQFYGMSSTVAMTKHSGGVASYRTGEGKEVLIPYKGPVEETIKDILGGVRSTCTYVGAKKIKYLRECVTFQVVSMQTNDIFGKS